MEYYDEVIDLNNSGIGSYGHNYFAILSCYLLRVRVSFALCVRVLFLMMMHLPFQCILYVELMAENAIGMMVTGALQRCHRVEMLIIRT